MTAKQQLLEYVETLSEDEAIEKLAWLSASGSPPPLSEAQKDQVRRALASLDAGRKTSHSEMKQRFGIA